MRSHVGAIGAPFGRGWRYVLPSLLNVLVLLLIACPPLTDSGAQRSVPSHAVLTLYEAGDTPASADIPMMSRVGNDADDLRETFTAAGPRLLSIAGAAAAVDPAGADKPDTRDDHPPDRPPRRIA